MQVAVEWCMGLRRVTLSVGRHSYTCELIRESDTSWKLRRVEVHKVGVAGHIDFHARSCYAALQEGEAVAKEIIALAEGDNGERRANR